MQNKYCLPIISSTTDEIRQKINKNEPDYGYFEIWLDYIENLEPSEISGLIDRYPGQIILVFRRQNLEPIRLDFAGRSKILEQISAKDCFVDLDIYAQAEDLNYIKNNSLQLKKIVSFHDYKETPDSAGLKSRIEEIKSYDPDIIKISAFCQIKGDALRLLGIQQELAQSGQRHIILGMGENGLVTRVFGTLWGNEFAFVPETSDSKSAEGQITRDKFEKIMKELTD